MDAEAGRRGESAQGATRIRALRLDGDGPASRDAQVELVGRDHWKDTLARATLVLLDAKDTPIAAASLDHEFRVEGEVYDAPKMAVPLRGPMAGAGDLRIAVGLRTTVVGAPMGSTWGRFLDGSSPYPVELLLAGDEPAAWRRGLAALDYEMGMTRAMRRSVDPDSARIDEAGWGAIHRIVRPHGGRLAALFPGARAAGPRELARLCLLAGYSGDDRLAGPLRPLLDDPDGAVRDAAAIGLGLLGHDDVKARLDAIVARPADESASDAAHAGRGEACARASSIAEGGTSCAPHRPHADRMRFASRTDFLRPGRSLRHADWRPSRPGPGRALRPRRRPDFRPEYGFARETMYQDSRRRP